VYAWSFEEANSLIAPFSLAIAPWVRAQLERLSQMSHSSRLSFKY
jgi:hypothetical protein